MNLFGWSYPPGCSGPPDPEPLPLWCTRCDWSGTDEDLPCEDMTDAEWDAGDFSREVCPGCGEDGCLFIPEPDEDELWYEPEDDYDFHQDPYVGREDL